MHRKVTAQSLVEMAFVAPILLMLLFGIIDMGYYIFSYATVTQAARNGVEAAAQLPPYEQWLLYQSSPPTGNSDWRSVTQDDCYRTIMNYVDSGMGTMLGKLSNFTTVNYPNDTTKTTADDQTRNLNVRGPIEVRIVYDVRPLTPLFQWLNLRTANGSWRFTAVARRSIENLGVNPEQPNHIVCSRDIADWKQKQDALNP